MASYTRGAVVFLARSCYERGVTETCDLLLQAFTTAAPTGNAREQARLADLTSYIEEARWRLLATLPDIERGIGNILDRMPPVS